MLIDFNNVKEMTFPGMNQGTGTMTARLYRSGKGKMIPCCIHPDGSSGLHVSRLAPNVSHLTSRI